MVRVFHEQYFPFHPVRWFCFFLFFFRSFIYLSFLFLSLFTFFRETTRHGLPRHATTVNAIVTTTTTTTSTAAVRRPSAPPLASTLGEKSIRRRVHAGVEYTHTHTHAQCGTHKSRRRSVVRPKVYIYLFNLTLHPFGVHPEREATPRTMVGRGVGEGEIKGKKRTGRPPQTACARCRCRQDDNNDNIPKKQ